MLTCHTRKMTANSLMPRESSHLMTPKPPTKHINRSNDIMVEKCQKLYRYSKRIFPSKRAISTSRKVWRRNLTVDFWDDVDILRLFCSRTQDHRHFVAPRWYQINISSNQKWTISHLVDVVVTFLRDCSRGGGRGRPTTCANHRISRVLEMRDSE